MLITYTYSSNSASYRSHAADTESSEVWNIIRILSIFVIRLHFKMPKDNTLTF